MQKLSFALENYLEAIYELTTDNKGARVTDIAAKMRVTKASTCSAMNALSDKGLITNEKYQEIFLTDLGREIAEFTSRKHQVIQRFFTTVLEIDFNTADKDACAIEHVISRESVTAMERYLGRTE